LTIHSQKDLTALQSSNQSDASDGYRLLETAFDAYAAGQCELGRQVLDQALLLEPLLKESAAIVTPIRNYAAGLMLRAGRSPADAVLFWERLFDGLPDGLHGLLPFRSTELAHAWIDVAFRAYALGQLDLVRRAVAQAVRLNPGWLANRGVLSLGAEALLGPQLAATFRDAKPGGLKRRVTLWRRKELIDRYLKNHPVIKVHIGCGGFALPGWLNSDLSPLNRGGIVHIDAAERLPFPDGSVDYIFSEHIIEHLTYPDGRYFLGECWRVLKPCGVCRVATPRLELLIDLYSDREGRYDDYVRTSFDRWVGGELFSRALVINNFFHNWGHRCIYDYETLTGALERAGFAHIARREIGESPHTALQGLERHGQMTSQEINALETMVVEAEK
jgi:predicted SAM-dependent methyltransferase